MALSKLIEHMNVFSDEISKTTLDAVPEIHCTINDEYDEVRTNPFAGIALWKMVTTSYAGSDMLRRDALREQLMSATHIPLQRAKDVPGWLNNLRNIFKESVQTQGNTGNSCIIADHLVMARKLTGKQFYALYDKVKEQTNSLFCGVQSSYNKLDPNGPAAM